MKDALVETLESAVAGLLSETGDADPPPPVVLDRPRHEDHGDFACNVAMVLAKRLGRPPREIAERLIDRLGTAEGLLQRSEVAGPGFMNFWLAGGQWHDVLREIVVAGSEYGRSDTGQGRSVQVEFVSANPTGPLSTGHGRQAILGDCIASLLERTGWAVTREYYFNNGGRQMRVLGQSLRARYLERLGRAAAPPEPGVAEDDPAWKTRAGLPVEFPPDGYRGEYLDEIARGLVESKQEQWLEEPADRGFRQVAEEEIFGGIRETLEKIGVDFDVFYSEQSLYEEGKLEETLADLRAKDLVYDAEEAVWLRSTKLDLDRDRVLVKRTGEPTYLLPDIAYHREKFRRGFDKVIDVLGADHIEQFPFVRAAVSELDCDPDRLFLVMHQFVTLTRGGEKVKQSTRRATFVTVDELVEEVGVDVFRFFMIERRADGHLDFDMDLAGDRNWRKNPAYYVQYAHARTHGIERKASEEGIARPDPDDFEGSRLELPEEVELIRKLGEFPEMIERAAESQEPHHVAYYLRDLAGLWNPYLQDGKRHRILSEDRGLTSARLGLTLAVRAVLSSGLAMLGVRAPEQM
ncbi:MAG: arginine--tRNA ligase [Myxococcota bacterium]|nr:arginine--tRNA ligase [Myxococcota bacterium]